MSRVIVSCTVGGSGRTQGDDYGECHEGEPREEGAGGDERDGWRVGGGGRPARGVPEQTVRNWKKAFLDAGRDRLVLGARRWPERETELEAECEKVKAALGEVHMQLRVWERGAE